MYDEGSKEVKVLKARENQSKEVKNLPVSALFIGSQDNLLYDETIKHKFKTEFTSKLARRSFFIFVNNLRVPLFSSCERCISGVRSKIFLLSYCFIVSFLVCAPSPPCEPGVAAPY